MYHGLKMILAVIIIAAAGLCFIGLAPTAKSSHETMIAMSTFLNRPSVFFMCEGKDNNLERVYS